MLINILQRLATSFIKVKEAVSYTETSVSIYQVTQHNIPADIQLHENLESQQL
jgi:hypothetical protein